MLKFYKRVTPVLPAEVQISVVVLFKTILNVWFFPYLTIVLKIKVGFHVWDCAQSNFFKSLSHHFKTTNNYLIQTEDTSTLLKFVFNKVAEEDFDSGQVINSCDRTHLLLGE